MKIGYQGIKGSNSEKVTKRFIEKMKFNNVELIPLINSKNVVRELNSGNIEYGIMAIRNTLGGIVEETEKAIEGQNLKLVYEDKINIHHCLFKRVDVNLNEITVIASHIQALKQTEENRKKLFPNCIEVEVEDTALAAKYLVDGTLHPNVAVICRKNAGEMFGLDLVCENFEDSKDNFTEFGVYVKK